MLITEKRLRQIVSSELKRMFLREAVTIDQIKNKEPNGRYYASWVELGDVLKRNTSESISSNFQNFASLGSKDRRASGIAAALRNSRLSDEQKLQSVLVILKTSDTVRNPDFVSITKNSMAAGHGLTADQFKSLTESPTGRPASELNKMFMTLASVDPVADIMDATTPPTEKKPASVTKQMPTGIDYTIVAGDTISKIFKTYYGIPATSASAELYDDAIKNLFFYNGQAVPRDANTIKAGAKMRLPDNLDFGGKSYQRIK